MAGETGREHSESSRIPRLGANYGSTGELFGTSFRPVSSRLLFPLCETPCFTVSIIEPDHAAGNLKRMAMPQYQSAGIVIDMVLLHFYVARPVTVDVKSAPIATD